jgi:hypothetical protein
MNVPVFKSEAQRQAYWKKQRMLELQLDEANDSKISKAYHDVDFGVVPAIRDTRSIKEIEQDTNLQRTLAKKNALTLMNNDGYEADKLLDLIGKPNYATFNRFAPDIIEKVRNQIGRIDANQAKDEIDLHFAVQLDPYRRVPPSAEQLNELINAINSRFSKSNKMVRDILLKLEAYREVIGSGPIPPNITVSMSSAEVDDSIGVVDDNYDDEDVLASLASNTAEITQESNTVTLAELEAFYAGLDVGYEEFDYEDFKNRAGEAKAAPPNQPTGDEPDGGDGGPIGAPKDDEGDGDEAATVQPQPEFDGDISVVRETYNKVGKFLISADFDEPIGNEMQILKTNVAYLMGFIGKPTQDIMWMNMEQLATAFYTNKQDIVNEIERIEQMESKPNAPTGGLDPDEIEDRLKNYEVVNYGIGNLSIAANNYLTYLPQLKAEAEAAIASKVTDRGDEELKFNPTLHPESFEKYRLLKRIAIDKGANKSKRFNYYDLQTELNKPIYQQTADLIEEVLGRKTVGSGIKRRKGRRGRRR